MAEPIDRNERKHTITNIRLLAVKALSEINRNGAYANITLQKYISLHQLNDLDRRFFTELVYGVIRRRNYLDAVITTLAGRPLKKLSSMVVEILRLGIYQLLYMDKVPASAAVNESVKLGKKLTRGLSGFINAVLRNVVRKAEEITIDELAKTKEERLSFIYNQPLWLMKKWLREMGEEETISLCEWFNQLPRLTARVNLLVTSVEACEKEMKEAGWDVERSTKLPDCLYIHQHMGSLESAKWVKEGWITLMDEASMVIAYAVDPQPGEMILDCCAAPGGKTMHLATKMKNEGSILAGDIHEHKVNLLNENAQRLHIDIVTAKVMDATKGISDKNGYFDRVLVDAPCSGLGVLQKKLDMRWRKTEEEIKKLPALQSDILRAAASLVKPNGVLVYSTCTINSKENEDVIHSFLKEHPDYSLEPLQPYIPFPVKGTMVQLTPAHDQMDGFFIARLRKEKK